MTRRQFEVSLEELRAEEGRRIDTDKLRDASRPFDESLVRRLPRGHRQRGWAATEGEQ